MNGWEKKEVRKPEQKRPDTQKSDLKKRKVKARENEDQATTRDPEPHPDDGF